MLEFLIRNHFVLMSIDFAFMLISGVLLALFNANIFGYIFTASVLVGLIFATIDVELHDETVERDETVDNSTESE